MSGNGLSSLMLSAAPPLIKLAFAGEQTTAGPANYDDELQQRIG